MCRAYLYIRKEGITGTKILEITRKEAISIIRANRRIGYDLGIFGGKSLEVIKSVYGEYAPFIQVDSKEELLKLS